MRRGRSRSPTCSRWAGRPAASSCSATRSSSSSRSRARTRRARSARRWRTSSATTRRCRRTAACFSPHTWRHAPERHRLHVGGVLRGPPRLRAARSSGRRSPARDRFVGAGPRVIAAEHAGAENVSPEEARRRGGCAQPCSSTSGASWTDRDGETRPIGWDDVLIVAPYNAQVGAIRAPAAARGAGRHGRQVPGPGGADQHLLDDDSSAGGSRRAAWTSSTHATGSTSPRHARDASPSSSADPALLRVRARTPEQMRLANALCRFAEMAVQRRAADPAADVPEPIGGHHGGPDARSPTEPHEDPIIAARMSPCDHRRPGLAAPGLDRSSASGAPFGRWSPASRSAARVTCAAVTVASIVAQQLGGTALWSGVTGATVVLGAAGGAVILSAIMTRRGRRTGALGRLRHRGRRGHRRHDGVAGPEPRPPTAAGHDRGQDHRAAGGTERHSAPVTPLQSACPAAAPRSRQRCTPRRCDPCCRARRRRPASTVLRWRSSSRRAPDGGGAVAR